MKCVRSEAGLPASTSREGRMVRVPWCPLAPLRPQFPHLQSGTVTSTFEGCCEVKRTEHVKRSAQPQAQNTHGGDYCLFSSDQFPYILSGRELKPGSVKRSPRQRHVLMDKETLKLDLFGSDFPNYPQAYKNKCNIFK